jgi:hypothetical protein
MPPRTRAGARAMADIRTFDESKLPLAISKMLPSGKLPAI